ncbi:MAG TPA: triple tyrosine motif-containing protein [Ferruginibacter sp.]|nr:triple tyrosine motif-containing protein [Ferruginibacter sp.]HRO18589.1 triple tyrosine motif-containing protein [Ferruginibacter sp.]HRQ21768.1 triple tyrosine motif-containing protein [Ferruginibacter sp.]
MLSLSDTHAQPLKRFNAFRYNVNEGLLQSTIYDLAFDGNNYCWISFPNGVQKFDGRKFYSVPMQEHLPDDKFVLFFPCHNGDMLMTHSKGISRYAIQQDKITTLYTFSNLQKIPPRIIGEADSILYLYQEDGTLSGIHVVTGKLITERRGVLPEYTGRTGVPIAAKNIFDHHTVVLSKNDLFRLNLKKFTVEKVSLPETVSWYMLEMVSANEVLFAYSFKPASFEILDFRDQSVRSTYLKNIPPQLPNVSMLHRKNPHAFLYTVSNRLFELNAEAFQPEFEWVNFQNQPIIGNRGLRFIREDRFGNIMLVSMMEGLLKIITNNYPIKYYGQPSESGNHILCVYPDKQRNRILAGTSGNGLLVFDTLQRLVKHIPRIADSEEGRFINSIIEMSQGDYLLFSTDKKEAYRLSNDLNTLQRIPIHLSEKLVKHGNGYFGNFLYQDKHRALIQSQGNIFKIETNPLHITEYFLTDFYIMSGICVNDQFIYHANDSLIFTDTSRFQVKRKVYFPNTGYVRCFVQDQQSNLYIGSNKGIFKTDTTGKVIWHLDKNDGLPDECIYAMLIDSEGLLWCSSNKGIFRIDKNKSILQLKKENGLQENEFNTNVAAIATDGEFYFGGVNGISSFYPERIGEMREKLRLLITGIRINNQPYHPDTAIWNVSRLELNHHQNNVSFDFLAMGPNNPDQYVYQYKMEGVDDQWIQNDGIQTIRYYLAPGKYTLKLFASRYFDKDASPLTELLIIIHPPIWKTWWFILSVSGLLLGLLIFSINRYNRQKYLGKLQQLENERRIQLERERISRDLHDNIGAFANAVLHKTETLAQQENIKDKNRLMEDIRLASRNIIVSLRETIWSFKKEIYTTEECMIRIRNFIQTMMRYYPDIHFKITDQAQGAQPIPYLHALNMVRMVQEGVTNAIKHAHPQHVIIVSSMENNEWMIRITDDGSGFNKTLNTGGNGLENLRYRAAQSGFGLSIDSKEGIGTTITITVK